MGYRRVPTIHTLTFDDYPGLEVRMKSIRIGKMRALLDTMSEDDGATSEEIEGMIKLITENLISWNLEEEDGAPVPADGDGVNDLELDMLLALINAWAEVLTGPTEELGKDSVSAPSSAGPSPELPAMIDL